MERDRLYSLTVVGAQLTDGLGSRSVIRGARPVDQWPLLDVGTVGSNSVLDPSYLSYLSYQFFNLHN